MGLDDAMAALRVWGLPRRRGGPLVWLRLGVCVYGGGMEEVI